MSRPDTTWRLPPCLCVFDSSMPGLRTRCADSNHPGPSRVYTSMVAAMIAFVKSMIFLCLDGAKETQRHGGHGETGASLPLSLFRP